MATMEPKNWKDNLTTSRAQDLVYIHNNLRLLSRNSNDDVGCGCGGDAFDSMEDVGFFQGCRCFTR
ncbi:hypothetical protein HanIR_Chr02g0059561 [Helianthus annuus]|nr:hypothetical protein HanIR_Chr02g0059561 [Helianthus annuus]